MTVVDEPFVDRAHGDGYVVHVWTIDDPPTMRELIGWDVDGIMTAEPTRLERVLCREGVARPTRPPGTPGRHCSRAASIACEVVTRRARLAAGRLVFVLRRHDAFQGRCAGFASFRFPAVEGRVRARFNFGWSPPQDGGPDRLKGSVGLARGMRRAANRAGRVTAKTHPCAGFVERAKLGLG